MKHLKKITAVVVTLVMVFTAIPFFDSPAMSVDYLQKNAKYVCFGGVNSAAITNNGDLYVWGENYHGQVGDGTKTDRNTPVKIMSSVATVNLVIDHSAAITESGDLYMWGRNNYGQLGDGTATDRYTPVKIMSGVATVNIVRDYSAAITTGGNLYMWGRNYEGQLGDGTEEEKHTPVNIMSGVTTVALGSYHSGALTTNGDLYIWGENVYGSVGDGTTTDRNTPVKIMSGVADVSLGFERSAAITNSGNLYTWGFNCYGQLGDGTATNRYTPVKIMSGVATVNIAKDHSAAISNSGDLYMWGRNSEGQLGDGTINDRYTPKKIMSGVAAMSLGYEYSAAVTTNSYLYMWGDNNHSQLGDGTTTDRYTPKKIMSGVTNVAIGNYHSGALTTNGYLYTWGENEYGRLGVGDTVNRTTPTLVMSETSQPQPTKESFGNSYITYKKSETGLNYPLYDEHDFSLQLKSWIDNSEYSEVFKDYVGNGYSYADLLNKTIDVPLVADDGTAYSVQSKIKVKDLMAYLLFAKEAQSFLTDAVSSVRTKIANGDGSAYSSFLSSLRDFNTQYYYFQDELNGGDAFNQTLYSLLLAKTAMAIVDELKVTYKSGEIKYVIYGTDEYNDVVAQVESEDIISTIPLKNYSYITDMYKANVSQSPQLYDNLYYYVLSGGDTSFLNADFKKTLNGYSTVIKDAKTLGKVIKGSAGTTDAVDFALDNLYYFADTYSWNAADKIKEVKDNWGYASNGINLINAVSQGSYLGLIGAAYSIDKAYIEYVKAAYDKAENKEAGWYALAYYYFGMNNPGFLKSIIDPDTGSAVFSINSWVTGTSGYDPNDIIENSLAVYYNGHAAYEYEYTPKADFRMYLWNASNTAANIMSVDCADYKDIMLEYLLGELNLERGIYGAVPECLHPNMSVTTTAATCTQDGSKTYTCSVCGYSYSEAIPKTGHSYSSRITSNATCTQNGSITYTCSTCGYSYSVSTPATGHNYTSSVTKQPSCTTSGVRTYSCTYCGGSYNEIIPAKGHTPGKVVVTPATCTIAEKTRTYCADCNDILSAVNSAPMLGHTPVTTVITAPTCTIDGESKTVCSVCNELLSTDTIPATGHNFEDGVCTVCGKKEESAPTQYMKGDINNDGFVNGKDANLLTRMCSGEKEPTALEKNAADVFSDGLINGKDANVFILFLNGTISSFD